MACTKAATIFVSYLTAAYESGILKCAIYLNPFLLFSAQEAASNSNQKTLTAAHVLQAIETVGFSNEFGPLLGEALEGN